MLRSRLAPLLIISALLALISLTCFALPMYIIWPFRRQGATELAIALFVKQMGPWVSIFCAALCLLACVFICMRTRSRVVRSGAIVLLALAIAGSVLSRVNVYELMFHHLDDPQFESAANAKLDPEDMVIAIAVNGANRAYPIREMAYHHVVNDTVGGEPVAATY